MKKQETQPASPAAPKTKPHPLPSTFATPRLGLAWLIEAPFQQFRAALPGDLRDAPEPQALALMLSELMHLAERHHLEFNAAFNAALDLHALDLALHDQYWPDKPVL